MPTIPVRFWFIVTAAGIAQIVGTIALLTLTAVTSLSERCTQKPGHSGRSVLGRHRWRATPIVGWVSVIAVLVGVVKLAARLTRHFVNSLLIVTALKQVFLLAQDLRLRRLASGGINKSRRTPCAGSRAYHACGDEYRSNHRERNLDPHERARSQSALSFGTGDAHCPLERCRWVVQRRGQLP